MDFEMQDLIGDPGVELLMVGTLFSLIVDGKRDRFLHGVFKNLQKPAKLRKPCKTNSSINRQPIAGLGLAS